MAVSRFAAINAGSYELMLKIYEISAGKKVRILDNVRYVMELGRETYTEKKVSFETIEKMCDILEKFTKVLEEYQVTDYVAVATSGIRECGDYCGPDKGKDRIKCPADQQFGTETVYL